MMENKHYYDLLRSVPDTAKKTIKAGRIKGMTDINPQWRYEVMTETFGPIGIGWKFEIINKDIIDGADNSKCAFVDILLYHKEKNSDAWSDPIPGTGGSSFIANEKNGPYTSDECFKMALTDALSVAMKMLGVAADVYRGFHESKYQITASTTPKPPISDKAFGQAIEKIENGERLILNKCLANFSLNVHQLQKLNELDLTLNDNGPI